MLNIRWSTPYTIREGFALKWRREWCIPKEMLTAFFIFWKKNKFKMLADGFSVSKSKLYNDWYLFETQDDVALFKEFDNTPTTSTNLDNVSTFKLPTYNIKDTNGLHPWQITSANTLISAINHWGAAIDGSELGTGKTYSACGVLRELDVPFVIVCPKPVMHQWEKVINKHFQLKHNLKGIINYELLIRGRKDSNIASYLAKHTKFTWKIPKNSIIIWDEAHRLKNFKTKASKTCIKAFRQNYKQLFLSATIASSPLDLRTIGTCVKLFDDADQYYKWAYEHGVYKGTWGLEFNNSPKALKKIHKYLFEERGIRLLRDTIPNFPETEIIVNVYDMNEEDTNKIKAIYDEMYAELKVLERKEKNDDSEMAIRIRALQKTEILKVALFEEMILDALESNMSIVVFLNYCDSIDALASRLKTNCIYDGRNEKVRQQNIELFQSGKERILITNIAAAREGLNLGDEDGKHPRLALISPPYSVNKLKQALGRIHRNSSKTKSIQKILYIANTQEENLVNSVGQKLENLTLINNGEITDDDLKI